MDVAYLDVCFCDGHNSLLDAVSNLPNQDGATFVIEHLMFKQINFLSNITMLRYWVFLAVFSLAIAGLFAIFLVLSKIPGLDGLITWPLSFFEKGLIAHVLLSIVVWYLAVFGCMIQTNRRSSIGITEILGFLILCSGTILCLIPAVSDRGQPTLNNYIPIIIDDLFYYGLGLIAIGTLGAGYKLLVTEKHNSDLGEAYILLIFVIIAIIISGIQLKGQPLNYAYNERLVWGGGHIMQFFNVTLLISAWSVIGSISKSNIFFKASILWLVLSGLVSLSFYFLWPASSEMQIQSFTNMQYASGISILIFLPALSGAMYNSFFNKSFWDIKKFTLWCSVTLFFVGGIFGIFVDGTDTRTPAHYHGMIGGINLAFTGLFYSVFFPKLGYAPLKGKLVSCQIAFYAIGQLLFIVGMYITGGMGAARKVMGTAIDMDNSLGIIAARVRDFGGGLAILGGILFIFICLRTLFRKPERKKIN